jgi:hypothetical protein
MAVALFCNVTLLVQGVERCEGGSGEKAYETGQFLLGYLPVISHNRKVSKQ